MRKSIAIALSGILTASLISGCNGASTYKSELTGTDIKEELMEQRPVAVPFDGDLPEADLTYLVKSGDRFIKLALIKDWKPVKTKTKPAGGNTTFEQIAAEWNAVLVTDSTVGMAYPYIDSISLPEFNGAAIQTSLQMEGLSETYNEYSPDETHFRFGKDNRKEKDRDCEAFNIGNETFVLCSNKKEYEQGSSGTIYDNIIIQEATDLSIGDEAYYNLSDMNLNGYLIKNGYARRITWARQNDLSATLFYDTEGQGIVLNPGKTCVIILDSDAYNSLPLR